MGIPEEALCPNLPPSLIRLDVGLDALVLKTQRVVARARNYLNHGQASAGTPLF